MISSRIGSIISIRSIVSIISTFIISISSITTISNRIAIIALGWHYLSSATCLTVSRSEFTSRFTQRLSRNCGYSCSGYCLTVYIKRVHKQFTQMVLLLNRPRHFESSMCLLASKARTMSVVVSSSRRSILLQSNNNCCYDESYCIIRIIC